MPAGKASSARPAAFVFNANAHQPGAQRLLGKIYDDNGVAQGEAALADIARHPSTAKFIAAKFARHFVADDPPPALVARLQEVFRKTDGDLKALATALVDSDEAWKAPLTKMRTPLRISDRDRPAAGADPGGSRPLSRRPQRAGSAAMVAGRAEWISPIPTRPGRRPKGIKLRLDISAQIASRLADGIDPRDLLELVAGGRGVAGNAAAPSSARNRGSRRWRCC